MPNPRPIYGEKNVQRISKKRARSLHWKNSAGACNRRASREKNLDELTTIERTILTERLSLADWNKGDCKPTEEKSLKKEKRGEYEGEKRTRTNLRKHRLGPSAEADPSSKKEVTFRNAR